MAACGRRVGKGGSAARNGCKKAQGQGEAASRGKMGGGRRGEGNRLPGDELSSNCGEQTVAMWERKGGEKELRVQVGGALGGHWEVGQAGR